MRGSAFARSSRRSSRRRRARDRSTRMTRTAVGGNRRLSLHHPEGRDHAKGSPAATAIGRTRAEVHELLAIRATLNDREATGLGGSWHRRWIPLSRCRGSTSDGVAPRPARCRTGRSGRDVGAPMSRTGRTAPLSSRRTGAGVPRRRLPPAEGPRCPPPRRRSSPVR